VLIPARKGVESFHDVLLSMTTLTGCSNERAVQRHMEDGMSYLRLKSAHPGRRSSGTVILSGLIAMVIPSFLMAQPSRAVEDTRGNIIEEIVVTARNVEESLQDVPVAVTVLDRDTLDMFRIDGAADLISRIPALTVSIGGSGASAQINLRGVGSSSISNAFDSAVALNYDGISVSTQRLLQSAFFDVDQVSVLKGPQSLFFGKAASAGVLALRSAEPTEEWQFGGKSSYEFEEEGRTIGGFVSGPITETLGFRLAAEYQDIDKYVRVADIVPTQNPDRGLTNLVSRATFNWAATDNVNVNLKLNYNRQRSDTLNGRQDVFCGSDGPDPSVLLGGALTGGGIPGIDLFLPTHDCKLGNGRFVGVDGNALINSVPTGSPGASRRDISQAYNDTDIFFSRLQFDVGLSENYDLTVLLGYVDLDNEYNDSFNSTGQNPDGSAAGLVAPFENTLKQFTSEVRLASNFSGPFNFQVGGFFEDREIGHKTSQNAFNPSLLGVFGPPFGPDAATGFTFDWLADRPIDAEALSFFVSGVYRLSEQWELSGGVRWTDEDKSTIVSFPYVHSALPIVFGSVSSGFTTDDIKFSDDNWSPEVVLRYIHNDDISVYGSFKTGFKSGGVDNNTLPIGSVIPDLNSTDPVVRAAAVDLLTFDSETSEGFELGFRSLLFDRSLMLNVTAFHIEYVDQQVQLFNPAVFAFDTFNAGEVRTRGVDIDWAWATPVQGLSLFGAWGFLDAKITGDLITASGENLRGRDSGSAPKFSGNIALNWETPLSDAFTLRVSPNIFYSASYIAGGAPRAFDAVTNRLGYLEQGSYTTIDLNISLLSLASDWRLSLIARNLTDKQTITGGGPAPFRPPTGDDQLVNFNRGQQIFLEAAYNF
jgi:iron complex outermembrane receptor protein